MTNPLDAALANAAMNAKNNGDNLYIDQLYEPEPELKQMHMQSAEEFAFESQANGYQLEMKKAYALTDSAQSFGAILSLVSQTLNSVAELHKKTNTASESIRLRLDALADMVSAITTTINSAASMPEPKHEHRSLSLWDDSTLLNELVKRENDLMPFYFELLKRIPANLQGHVDESMKGKYQSLGVLSKLCAALTYSQPQAQIHQVGLSESAEQRLSNPNEQGLVKAYQIQQMSKEELDAARRYSQSDYRSTIINEVLPTAPIQYPFDHYLRGN